METIKKLSLRLSDPKLINQALMLSIVGMIVLYKMLKA
jgi:hypothetical protein